jgi:hypothetical protein
MWAETMDFARECPMAIPMGICSEILSKTAMGSGLDRATVLAKETS